MAYDIYDRTYGCLVGGAIGDALGAAVEGWPYHQIRDEYGKIDEFKEYYMPYTKTDPGSVTADSTIRQYVSIAVFENGGRISPEQFADILQEHLNPSRVWVNGEIVVKKLSAGVNPWYAGRGTIPDNKVTSAITPIGVVNACNPTQAYQDAFNVASVLQDDYHQEISATVAAGVAAAFEPDATVQTVIDTMMEQTNSILLRAMDLTLEIAERSQTVDKFVEAFYEEMLDWRWPAVQWGADRYHEGKVFSADALETVPVAMAILTLCDGHVNESIIEGANFGRDSDAIATLTGSIGGVLEGADTIRESWVDQCEEVNEDLFDEIGDDADGGFHATARRLVSALERERDTAEERASELNRLLNPPHADGS